jgi:signal transduction histidine kinase
MHPRLLRELHELGLAVDALPDDDRWRALLDRLDRLYAARGAEADQQGPPRVDPAAQRQKWEALGRLAAGIAHEINTPIQFVGNNVNFLSTAIGDLMGLCADYQDMCHTAFTRVLDERDLHALKRSEDLADLDYIRRAIPQALTAMREGVERVTRIVLAVKNFSHPGVEEKAPADINAAVQSTLTLAANELKYVASVETELGELPPVTCYIGDINQALLNLVVNAAHAIADAAGGRAHRGRIRIRTSHGGAHVEIAISDNGCGIAPEIQARVFDPFFTTKEPGRGTGQGLPLARAVVVGKHGGSLTFETEAGAGTTFFVRLPVGGP